MTFLENLSDKQNLATEAAMVALATTSAATITTANTVTTLVNYSSPSVTAYDVIEFSYLFDINNASANSEVFTVTVDLGTPTYTQSYTVANGVTAEIGVQCKLVNIGTNYMVQLLISDGTTVKHVYDVIAKSALTGFLVSAENTSVVAATLTITGQGGYGLFDTVSLLN